MWVSLILDQVVVVMRLREYYLFAVDAVVVVQCRIIHVVLV